MNKHGDDVHPPSENGDAAPMFLNDVLHGLASDPKALPPKYFYDAAGAALFGDICELPEYYVTRTEVGILRQHAADIAGALGPQAMLVEYGAGSLDKIRILLDAMATPAGVIAVDISEQQLLRAAEDLRRAYAGLWVSSVAADFTGPVDLPNPQGRPARNVVFFPGSTIGNFDPDGAVTFMRSIAETVGADGGLLIGIDLKKDLQTLIDAYDDGAGVTAAFNKNLLTRINRELDADFDIDHFRHEARYDVERGRIEMHLESLQAQTVTVAGRTFDFIAGETIHTENSYKYLPDEFAGLAAEAGFKRDALWTDAERRFGVMLFRKA